MLKTMAVALALAVAPAVLAGDRTPSPHGAVVYIISPADGETASGPLTIRFGLKGMGVAPAGVEKEKTGHHHLLIDVADLPPLDQPIRADDNHRHFGGGQTEATLELLPGPHTLQLLLADRNPIPHQPPVASEKITVTAQ
jgi:hypothetical protein